MLADSFMRFCYPRLLSVSVAIKLLVTLGSANSHHLHQHDYWQGFRLEHPVLTARQESLPEEVVAVVPSPTAC